MMMRERMVNTGNFRWHPWEDGYAEKRGDIYLNEDSHTAMCMSESRGIVGEFTSAEDGSKYGNTGDQYGTESCRRLYGENEVWDGILECICTEQDESIVKCATLQDMDYSANQRWKLEPVSGNSFRLKNVGTNLYLDVSNAHTGSWAELIAFIPTGGANQVFEFVPCFYGLIKAYLLKAFSGMVLENTFEVGERVFTTMPESREIKQQWVLLNVDNGECMIINQRSGLVLGVL